MNPDQKMPTSASKPNRHDLLGALYAVEILIQVFETGVSFDEPTRKKIIIQVKEAQDTIQNCFRSLGAL